MKQLLIVKPKTISQKDKSELKRNGFILIEHPFPGDVRVLIQSDLIEYDNIFQAAIKGANYNSYSRETFAESLLKSLTKKPEIKTP